MIRRLFGKKPINNDYTYIALKSSRVFHTASCHMLEGTAEEDRVGFRIYQQAVALGRRPCKICNPRMSYARSASKKATSDDTEKKAIRHLAPVVTRARFAVLFGIVIAIALIVVTGAGFNNDAQLDDDAQTMNHSVTAENPETFYIQVAAFRSSENAEEYCHELSSKGYHTRIEYPTSTDESWYRVLIGKFLSEHDAISFSGKLYEQEGFPYMRIRHCIMEMRERFQTQPYMEVVNGITRAKSRSE